MGPDRYQGYLLSLAVGIFISIAGWVGLFYYQLGSPTLSSRWTFEINDVKKIMAASMPGRRILIIAGSNGLFGINAERMTEALGIPTVNLSTNAGLGIEFILDRIGKLARRDDVVLMALEYSLYQYNGLPDENYLDYIISLEPGTFRSLPFPEKIRMMFSISLERLVEGIRVRFNAPAPLYPGKNHPWTLNAYGDVTGNHVEERSKILMLKVVNMIPTDYRGKFNPRAEAWRIIRNYADWCRSEKITLLATFPSYVFFPEYTRPEQRQYFDSISDAYRDMGVPVLGKPYDFMYGKPLFFDSSYHLNQQGMKIRTDQLINLMKPYL